MAHNVEIEVRLSGGEAVAAMASEVRAGLTAESKTLPSKYFYDERGSELFERITELPEYYLTRAEQALLERHAREVARRARPAELLELGSGSAKKTRALLDAALAEGSLVRYVGVEVSQEIAEATARELGTRYPGLEILALVGDFEQHLGRIPEATRRLVALLGSTIGNFAEPEDAELLEQVAHLLGRDGRLLLGLDVVKDPRVLEAAYNDSRGVTAEFNRNILAVLNRNLDADFDLGAFEHVARWNGEASRIESSLRSTRSQRVCLRAIPLTVELDAGELVRTEVSCKYTRASAARLFERSGLSLEAWFTDEAESFALALGRR